MALNLLKNLLAAAALFALVGLTLAVYFAREDHTKRVKEARADNIKNFKSCHIEVTSFEGTVRIKPMRLAEWLDLEDWVPYQKPLLCPGDLVYVAPRAALQLLDIRNVRRVRYGAETIFRVPEEILLNSQFFHATPSAPDDKKKRDGKEKESELVSSFFRVVTHANGSTLLAQDIKAYHGTISVVHEVDLVDYETPRGPVFINKTSKRPVDFSVSLERQQGKPGSEPTYFIGFLWHIKAGDNAPKQERILWSGRSTGAFSFSLDHAGDYIFAAVSEDFRRVAAPLPIVVTSHPEAHTPEGTHLLSSLVPAGWTDGSELIWLD